MRRPRRSRTSPFVDGGRSYGIGRDLVRVTFGEKPVTVTGTPTLSLATGTPADPRQMTNCASGTGTATLHLRPIQSLQQQLPDLDYASTGAAGRTIKDLAGDAAVLTLAAPGAAGSLGANKALVVDGVVPTVTSVTSATPNRSSSRRHPHHGLASRDHHGQPAPAATTFATGSPGATTCSRAANGTATLTFTYTVRSDDDSGRDPPVHHHERPRPEPGGRSGTPSSTMPPSPSALASAAFAGGATSSSSQRLIGATSTDWNTRGSNWTAASVQTAGVDVVIYDIADDGSRFQSSAVATSPGGGRPSRR